MSAPRLVLSGLEPGPALALAAGAVTAGFVDSGAVRPVAIGLDLPLWRLLYDAGGRAPRVLDPVLHDGALLTELADYWCEGMDLALFVAVEPVLDRWRGVEGSRAVDLALRLDTPAVLVLDARDRGPTTAAAALGVRGLARHVELAGVIVVGGDDPDGELAALLGGDGGLPVLGWIPPQLSEQFSREYAMQASIRQLGPRPDKGGLQRLCREASRYLHLEELEAAAGRRGYLPAAERRVLVPTPAAAELTLAVAWGPPLQPLALENIDVLQAMGLTLLPMNVSRDGELPPGTDGLLLAGQLDEEQLPAFAQNTDLHGAIAEAVAAGLPTLAYGGGALLLLRRLADSRGRSHELAGVLPAEAELLESYERPRYVGAQATRGNPFDEGETSLYELVDLEFLVLEQEAFAYQVNGEAGPESEGFVLPRLLATSLYPSLARQPRLAHRFIESMRAVASRT